MLQSRNIMLNFMSRQNVNCSEISLTLTNNYNLLSRQIDFLSSNCRNFFVSYCNFKLCIYLSTCSYIYLQFVFLDFSLIATHCSKIQ